MADHNLTEMGVQGGGGARESDQGKHPLKAGFRGADAEKEGGSQTIRGGGVRFKATGERMSRKLDRTVLNS